MKKTRKQYRLEQDALGTKRVPVDAYAGIFYSRAKENFSLSTRTFPREFFHNLAIIKRVSAEEHVKLKQLDEDVGKAIARATREIEKGTFDKWFDVDVYEAGAGTPLNMTMNEVIANRALELLHERKGKYARIHPNNHVNMGQSTNDVIPTALRVTTLLFSHELENELEKTIRETLKLSKRYSTLAKTGRTHVQAAVPVTFGQELSVYAQSLRERLETIREARNHLLTIPLGGTAVGTGITTTPHYARAVVQRLTRETRLPLREAPTKMLLTSHMTDFQHYSNALSELASDLQIWMNDWVLLGSDPYAGLGEIHLPEVEPGSSIMPGKINPSILEALKMITLQVQGNHETIRLSCESTQLELNVMTPVMGSNLFESIRLLTRGIGMFREKCLVHVRATPRMSELLQKSTSVATALNPYMGYDVVAFLVKKSLATHTLFSQLVINEGLLLPPEANVLLQPDYLTKPRKVDAELRTAIRSRTAYQKIREHVQKYSR